MARFDRFMVAPLNTGLETDQKPWLIPDDAFAQLTNAYVFRSRVRKRFGSYLMNQAVDNAVAQQYSRLRVQVGTVAAPISPVPGTIFKVGQMFSVGDQFFTVVTAGNPAPMITTGPGAGTYSTVTGAFTIAGTGLAGGTPIYFYPAEPVMGLINYESANINNEPLFAFDTQFAYQFNGTAWQRLGTAVWTGNNAQFFWGYTYIGTTNYDYFLFVSNFNAPDLIKYWDGATWTDLNPAFNAAGDTIQTARLVVPFKDRLVLLNTVEEITAVNRSFPNRARFSQNGSPVAVDAWREDIPGRGGYLDAPIKEAIVTCEFLKDRLIVYFERSTWELVYTGNEILPFRWQQINTELGAESTFSVVPFDKVVLGVGNVGIHACNGSNVERIDQKIPDTVFEITNDSEGVFRVYGIRDYFAEMVYWTFPSRSAFAVYPTRVLVFNYKTGSWAFNDDSITAFGYFQPAMSYTWATSPFPWQQADFTWGSATTQSQFRYIVGGNQEGFVFIIDTEFTGNALALQITNATTDGVTVTFTVIDHNLSNGQYVYVNEMQGMTGVNNQIYQVIFVSSNTFKVVNTTAAGAYTGGGVIARVTPIDILTKQYNFYVDQGRNATVSKVDFQVDRTVFGEITIDAYVSSTELSTLAEGEATGAIVGTNALQTFAYTLYPLEQVADRLWHPVYLQAEGEFIQLRLYMTPDQVMSIDNSYEDFQLHAMTFYALPTTARLQ